MGDYIMEILSTGEKIKRARIYKGITLKQLCQDRISISKMSCIENGKVKADKEIIEYVASKIDVDYDYLIQDVYEQILNNLKLIKASNYKDDSLEESIKHNLFYAEDYEYLELAFELIHILFNYYLDREEYEKIETIVSQYYDLYQKNNTVENTIIYLDDMANFLLKNKEFRGAIAYYSRLRKVIKDTNVKNSLYSKVCYYEGLCYCLSNEIEEGYELLTEAMEKAKDTDDDKLKFNICKDYSVYSIVLNKENVKVYIEKSMNYANGNQKLIAEAKAAYGKAYFMIANKEEALKNIDEAVKCYPEEDKENYVVFLNKCISVLFEYKQYEKAYDLTDKALDLAIETNNINYIEKGYYYKGSILQKQGQNRAAEMYMNLSLDSLFKCGNKRERNKRYLEMGNMYYNLGDIKDSIKYFSLAMENRKTL